MYDVIIIGAGVVGCATAYYLSQYNIKVALLEKCNDVSNGTSKANSAIIHAGYDPAENSLMAKLNVRGSLLAKQLCQQLDVPYKQCGALVLGFDEDDKATIEKLYQRGLNNKVEGLAILNHDQIKEIEPEVSDEVLCALYAPTSAIISPWEYTLAFGQNAVINGLDLKLNNEVETISKEKDIFTIRTNNGQYQSKYIINAAGVNSDKVAEMICEKEFTILPAKGEYHLLDKAQGARIKHTLFQCPNRDGKGVLVSPTVHGNLIVGPNSAASEADDVTTTSEAMSFVKKQAAKTCQTIDYRDDIRNFAGVRARSDSNDFIISESKSVKNFYNLAGICSPGLSAAPAIGEMVLAWLLERENYTKKDNYKYCDKKIRFKNLSNEEKDKLIKENPAYGKVICRCETITEGEILDCLKQPIPPVSLDGVKRRCNSSMGRCQGGFCGEKIAMILMQHYHLKYDEILQNDNGSTILKQQAKEGY